MIDLGEVYNKEILEMLRKQPDFRLRTLWANICAQIYRQTPWSKITGSEIAPNIFQMRLYFAAKESNIPDFIDRICTELQISSPFIDMDLVHEAEGYANTMGFFRSKTRLFTAYAMKLSKYMKEEGKRAEE
jgi:hypothetical protein